jgi:hypothetical protein
MFAKGFTGAESLAANVVVNDDAPNECTIYPREADDHRRMAAWITATEGSYEAIERQR